MFWGTYTCGGKRPLSGARNFAPMNLEKISVKGSIILLLRYLTLRLTRISRKINLSVAEHIKKNNDKSEQDIRWLSESLEWMSMKIEP